MAPHIAPWVLHLAGVPALVAGLQRLNLQGSIARQEIGSKGHSALLFLGQVIVNMTTGVSDHLWDRRKQSQVVWLSALLSSWGQDEERMGIPGGPVIGALCFHCRGRGFIGELRSCMQPRGEAKKKKTRKGNGTKQSSLGVILRVQEISVLNKLNTLCLSRPSFFYEYEHLIFV